MRITSTSRLGALLCALVVAGSVANALASHPHGGVVLAWGGAQNPPVGEFRSLSQGGSSQGLGIRPDGELVLWGGFGDPFAIPPLPANITNQVFIGGAIAKSHLLAITWDGRVIGWGDNTFGQRTAPTDDRFTAVAAGARHSVGIALDGTLRGWGDPTLTDVPEGRFIDVSARATYTLAVRRDGTLLGWGIAPEIFSQWTSDGAGHFYLRGERFTEASAGVAHALALTKDNRVLGWGSNADGEINMPSGVRFRSIAAGERYSLGIAVDGRLHAWGDNSSGQIDQAPSEKLEAMAAAAHNAFAILK